MITHEEYKNAFSRGFSLIELSVVLVIIGILLAGASVGQSMMEAARLNSVINDYRTYKAAYNNFEIRYNALPGDFNAAGTIWPTTCTTTGNPADCNGNGNGLIGDLFTEEFLFWEHLELAGMISAGITPFNPSAGFINQFDIGTRMPASQFKSGGYLVQGLSGLWPNNVNVMILFGIDTINLPISSKLSVTQAYSIDQKMDDGSVDANGNFTGAMTGNIRTFGPPDSVTACLTGDTASFSSIYNTIFSSGAQAAAQSIQNIASGIYYNMQATRTCSFYMALNQ